MSISRRSVCGLVAALVLWSALAWLAFNVNRGGHACSILTTEGASGEPTLLPPQTQAEWDELMHQRCDRPPSPVAIVVFGTGYVIIVAGFLARADRPPDKSRDDPLAPGG